MKHLTLFFLLSTFTSFAFAEDTCIDCAERKIGLCSEECGLVPPERMKDCQKQCLGQYCEHRCKSGDNDILTLLNVGCEKCKEQQFGLCNSNCDIKSEYQKAICQIECSVKRCANDCK